MKINLKFGTKKEPVQTGLQVHTHMRAGSHCEDVCKLMYQPGLPGLDLGCNDPRFENISNPRMDNCLWSCKAYDRPR